MATETIFGRLGDAVLLSTAAGGTAITTTEQAILLADGMEYVELITRNYSTAVVVQIGFAPWLTVLRTQDALATAPTDYSAHAQGTAAGDVILDSQDTAANLDFLYVGSDRPFKGVIIDVDKVNGTASVLTVKYWTGSAWTDISDTDGTASGGASLAQDGIVNWTVPSDWAKDDLQDIGDVASSARLAETTAPRYWTRWEFSAAIDSEVELVSMVAQQEFTEIELPTGAIKEFRVQKGPGKFGGLCVETDAGTANLIVNAYNFDARLELGAV
tara:strand:+ start:716 stop:1531 length:816 start_codon:yes stop_codon:yes gene_type:complete